MPISPMPISMTRHRRGGALSILTAAGGGALRGAGPDPGLLGARL